nr:hypothetical protein Iba_chr11bCG5440 [Ipomoea batatas]
MASSFSHRLFHLFCCLAFQIPIRIPLLGTSAEADSSLWEASDAAKEKPYNTHGRILNREHHVKGVGISLNPELMSVNVRPEIRKLFMVFMVDLKPVRTKRLTLNRVAGFITSATRLQQGAAGHCGDDDNGDRWSNNRLNVHTEEVDGNHS